MFLRQKSKENGGLDEMSNQAQLGRLLAIQYGWAMAGGEGRGTLRTRSAVAELQARPWKVIFIRDGMWVLCGEWVDVSREAGMTRDKESSLGSFQIVYAREERV